MHGGPCWLMSVAVIDRFSSKEIEFILMILGWDIVAELLRSSLIKRVGTGSPSCTIPELFFFKVWRFHLF